MSRRGSADNGSGDLGTVALVGNYMPRECGIATFSKDLLTSLRDYAGLTDCYAIAMNDDQAGYNYPAEVRFEVNYQRPADYHMAARFLNMNRTAAVSLQHEYGIYGGESGCLVLDLLDQLHMPVMTTLHTVLKDPDPSQKFVLERIAEMSDCLIVMSEFSGELLRTLYGVESERIVHIPHGIPDLPFVDPSYYKDQFKVEGRRVILTFGLLSPGKGIEYMIQAMPEVVRQFPDAIYIVLGKTHPNVLRANGEQYRISLQQTARQLGIQENVVFHNEYVSLQQLIEFLGCADVYVTPYLNEAQAVSGTLAYALGAGKAVVSTPYWYAREMLAEGRGSIVPFKDADALACGVCDFFSSTTMMSAVRKKAYLYCRTMTWSSVARQYAAKFSQLAENRLRSFQALWHPKEASRDTYELPPFKFDHLRTLSDCTGVLQHARFTVPEKKHGYTTDDNARALLAMAMACHSSSLQPCAHELLSIYLSFLDFAFNEQTGRFRNLLSYDRRWLEKRGSEDSHSRALWALGTVVNLETDEGHVGVAMNLFDRALPAVHDFKSPRAWANTLLAIHSFQGSFPGARTTRRIRDDFSRRLMVQTLQNLDDEWIWPEDRITYDNARIPNALLATGADTGDDRLVDLGLKMLDWLFGLQIDEEGVFIPIGNQGWYTRGDTPSRYDQQPLEAEGTIAACLEAFDLTQETVWKHRAAVCMDWFLGFNDARTPLYDYATGGCHDGLQSQGINQNEGAESTIAWLTALLSFMKHRASLRGRGLTEAESMKGRSL